MRTKQSVTALLLVLITGSPFGFSLHAAAKAEHRTAAAQAKLSSKIQRNFSLLDSLGTCPRTAMVREYVTTREDVRDIVGREYATDMPLDEAAGVVTEFCERKLLAQGGWKTVLLHAAISCWEKRKQVLCLIRSGPNDDGPDTGDRVLKETTPPANAKFFFSIEVESK